MGILPVRHRHRLDGREHHPLHRPDNTGALLLLLGSRSLAVPHVLVRRHRHRPLLGGPLAHGRRPQLILLRWLCGQRNECSRSGGRRGRRHARTLRAGAAQRVQDVGELRDEVPVPSLRLPFPISFVSLPFPLAPSPVPGHTYARTSAFGQHHSAPTFPFRPLPLASRQRPAAAPRYGRTASAPPGTRTRSSAPAGRPRSA
ncbi:hypothetical protein B0H10DRAFT_1031744 [Mycena sp. CBHHK59/15]|nr:hypothetical protein B0H10DRAFT_1031744 [Mycena sp. CBHHK59/15]